MEQFYNEQIDIDTLPKYEKAALSPLHPAYWKVIVINICLTLLVMSAAAAAFIFFNEEVRAYSYCIAAFLITLAVILFGLFRLSFERRGIAVRERDIIYSSGILSAKTTVVPFSRIQHIALNEGIFSRMFGLGELDVYTAGGVTGNVKIHGLGIDEANRIKGLLTKKLDNAVA